MRNDKVLPSIKKKCRIIIRRKCKKGCEPFKGLLYETEAEIVSAPVGFSTDTGSFPVSTRLYKKTKKNLEKRLKSLALKLHLSLSLYPIVFWSASKMFHRFFL